MVNRSGLIQMTITTDSIKTQRLSPDFKPKQNKQVNGDAYYEIINLNDRLLIIGKSKKDTAKFSATTIINFTDKKYFQIAWNIPDTAAYEIKTLVDFFQKDTRQLWGYTVYSEHYVDTLMSMKSIETMSLTDFKKYLNVYVNKMKDMKKDMENTEFGYMGVFSLNFQVISQSLYDIGYNPLQNIGTVETLYKKFHEDKGVKRLLKKIEKE